MTTGTLIAYHGDPALKKRFLAELKAHADADAIVQGVYSDEMYGYWKGCAVGCSIHSMANITGQNLDPLDYSLYPVLLGIPEWLAHLEDVIFEALSVWEARPWPIRFAEAIPVGADLEPVRHRYLEWLLSYALESIRILRILHMDDEALADRAITAITAVGDLHAARVPATDPRWTAARTAACAACKSSESAARVMRAVVWATEQASAPAVARAACDVKVDWSDQAGKLLALLASGTNSRALRIPGLEEPRYSPFRDNDSGDGQAKKDAHNAMEDTK